MEDFLGRSGKEASTLQNQIDADKRTQERMQQAPPHGHGRGPPRVGFMVLLVTYLAVV
jgi:hypothetical protein